METKHPIQFRQSRLSTPDATDDGRGATHARRGNPVPEPIALRPTPFNQRRVWRLLVASLAVAGLAAPLAAAASPRGGDAFFGIRLRLGWKYDDLRMCGATGPGAPHGPDIDVSAFAELPLSDDASLDVNLPLFRPIMLGVAGRMVQLEPEATLLFRTDLDDGNRLVAGPSLGFSLHYGPDLLSTSKGAGRTPSFWAFGPRLGGYVGVDFVRPTETFNFQLGLHPYFEPLFAIADERARRGRVAGLTLDSSFRFRPVR